MKYIKYMDTNDVPLNPKGTNFMKEVWTALQDIMKKIIRMGEGKCMMLL